MSRTENLVSTDWAVENLTTPGLVFVEVDEDTAAYDGGHVPGAIKISWKDDLRDKVRYDFIDKAGLEKLFSDKGIGNDDTIVLYGGNNNWFAAYAYWFFTLYGHGEVKLIDGGRKKWELEGLPLSSETVTREATSYTAKDADLTIRAFRDDTVAAIGGEEPGGRPLAGRVRRASSAPPPTCRRRTRSGVATSRAPSTSRGRRRPTRTARSSPTPNCRRSTPTPVSTTRRRRSPTAGSASGPATPGSC